MSIPGDLWLCGPHRVLCGDATNPEAVARPLGDRRPILVVTDRYAISSRHAVTRFSSLTTITKLINCLPGQLAAGGFLARIE